MRWVSTYQCRLFWISQRIEEETLIWNLIKHLLYPLTNININYKYHKHLLKHQLANIHDQPVNNCIHQHQRNSSNPPMQPPSPTPHSDHPNHSVVLPEMAARSVKIHTNSKDGAFFWKDLLCFATFVVGSSKTNHDQPTYMFDALRLQILPSIRRSQALHQGRRSCRRRSWCQRCQGWGHGCYGFGGSLVQGGKDGRWKKSTNMCVYFALFFGCY